MRKVVNILGDITSQPWTDSDVSLSIVLDQINGATKADEIEVNINSYGGEVFEAVAIANVLAASPAIKSFNILGVCASAATILFNATDNVSIARGAMVMYHKPIVAMQGNANDLRKTAKTLDKIEKTNIIANLSVRTGKGDEELAELLAGEWWLDSEEAISILGFTGSSIAAIENKAKTSQIGIYENYMKRKKALMNNAYHIFINHKNKLK